MQFDDQLRDAFRRHQPDAAFAERTMAVIRSRSREDRGRRRMSSAWIGLAAAVLLVLAGTMALNHQRVVRARQEVELALRIASQTLNHVQLKLEESSARKGMPDGR